MSDQTNPNDEPNVKPEEELSEDELNNVSGGGGGFWGGRTSDPALLPAVKPGNGSVLPAVQNLG